jgi:L-arabinose isomerase
MDGEAIQKEIAEMDKRLALLEQKVDQIDKNVSSINANLSKILWIVGGGFIMAAIGWVIRGGLGN